MAGERTHLDRKFIESQKRRLEAMREQALSSRDNVGREESQLRDQQLEPGDMADRGAELTRRDIDSSVDRVETRRLEEIERALEKIDQGTYGISDESGEPIPKERLEARPEAVRTVEEEQEEEERTRAASNRPRPEE